ncbi:unnamed protein product, partial [Discosporangium mesarthrocarpum]
MLLFSRVDNIRIPRRMFWGDLVPGVRKEGDQEKNWRDGLHDDLQLFGIETMEWVRLGADEDAWYTRVVEGAKQYMED